VKPKALPFADLRNVPPLPYNPFLGAVISCMLSVLVVDLCQRSGITFLSEGSLRFLDEQVSAYVGKLTILWPLTASLLSAAVYLITGYATISRLLRTHFSKFIRAVTLMYGGFFGFGLSFYWLANDWRVLFISSLHIVFCTWVYYTLYAAFAPFPSSSTRREQIGMAIAIIGVAVIINYVGLFT
jgi:hypothetical protein